MTGWGVFAYAKDFSTTVRLPPSVRRNDGNGIARRPSSSVNVLHKTLPSLLRNATFPLVGKVRALRAEMTRRSSV
jgi:hypothetical protein